ncbi:MAG: hypothetical protein WCI57_03920 [Candidatus Berkelbacteria bacterium]
MNKTKNNVSGIFALIFALAALANLFLTAVLVRYFFINTGIFDSSQGPFAVMMLFAVFIFCLISVFLTRTYWQSYIGVSPLRWPAYASSVLVLIELFFLLAGLRLI